MHAPVVILAAPKESQLPAVEERSTEYWHFKRHEMLRRRSMGCFESMT